MNPNDHVNKCQSTNDAYPTGFRIAVYTSILKLIDAINQLGEGFQRKAAEFQDDPEDGSNQLQDAVPMTLGGNPRIQRAADRRDQKPAAHRRTAAGSEPRRDCYRYSPSTPHEYEQLAVQKLAEVSNLAVVPAEDLIEATSDCGAYVMVHSSLKRLAVKMSRSVTTFACSPPATCRPDQINLPELQAGSSIMPAKVNPVVPEVVNQVCFKVIGNDTTVTMASEAGQLQLNVMEPVDRTGAV
ncbi:lyase family protein [Escherichia coli]